MAWLDPVFMLAAFEEARWLFEINPIFFGVLLDVPLGGQGFWRASDKFLFLES